MKSDSLSLLIGVVLLAIGLTKLRYWHQIFQWTILVEYKMPYIASSCRG